jgi:hypothetical protein
MRAVMLAALSLLPLAGCQKREEAPATAAGQAVTSPGLKGRFIGIGIYSPGEMWAQLVGHTEQVEAPSTSPVAANLEDDGYVIVVVDSATGEIRQCGNLSGRCFAMNPWTSTVPPAPALLLKHQAQIRADEEAANREAEVRLAADLRKGPRRTRSPRR